MPRWAWLATFAIGCGHPSAPASPSASPRPTSMPDAAVDAPLALHDDPPRLAARAVQLYLEWQRAFTEAGTDCAVATSRMNALADAYADLIEANRRVMRGPRDKQLAVKAELDKHAATIDPAAQAIIQSQTMAKCATEPAFAKAVDRLAGEG